jgi:hypothetical protein
MKRHTPIPKDFPVQPLKPGDEAEDRATCGTCGLSWDDGEITSMTPAPSGRCPFEDFHIYPPEPGRVRHRRGSRGRGHSLGHPQRKEPTMTAWYSLAGTVTVKDCEEARCIVSQLNDFARPDGYVFIDDDEPSSEGELNVEFNFGTFMSYSSMSEIEDLLKELGEYAVEPALLQEEGDEGAGTIYVGPEDRERETRSAEALQEIRNRLRLLTEADAETLTSELMDPATWMKH